MSDIHTNKSNKSQTAQDEESILRYWQENNIFEKSISQREGMDSFVFYDGPPFATGLPHYGHILPGTIKDVIPRYQTMCGKQVIRKWGWDCHGLPIENIIEKKLNLNSRKDILDYGVENFNRDAREQVMEYKDAWEQIIPRTGRWVDMDDHYKTMDASYTESCWWAFKELDKKGLVYKGYKPMHLCPRCETTLSNNEVAEGYKDITDISVTVPFELADEPGTYLLAWTTTPWTLPGNTAIAVGDDVTYVKIRVQRDGKEILYILAQARVQDVMSHAGISQWEEVAVMGADALVGRSYVPPYDYYRSNTELENHEHGWKIWSADFVNDQAGTGIAHEAPAFGADDYHLAQEHNIPVVHHVGTDGRFVDVVSDFAGILVKSKDDHQAADIAIIKDLAHKGLLFSKEKIIHAYPHCWRCDTPLLNYATSSWFIKTTQLRERMLSENSKIDWVPDHLGHKRFHNWIENNVDWAVSRSRFWGAPLPVWENQTTGEYEVIGSLNELKNKTRSKNNYIFIRHGESVGNVEGVMSFERDDQYDRLTEQGKEQVQHAAKSIQQLVTEDLINDSSGVDVVISSPFNRTKQTAQMLAHELGVEQVVEDDRVREWYIGDGLHGSRYDEYFANLANQNVEHDYHYKEKTGESGMDVKQRVMDFMYDIDQQHSGKTIVIVTHFGPLWTAFAGAAGMDAVEMKDFRSNWGEEKNANPLVLDFAPIPHNDQYELDFHLPYPERITWLNDSGHEYRLVGEVFDCWYESGSMPYAAKHYLGDDENKDFVYPADFISEAIDQTRGWFYSLLALGASVFDRAPMQNVIVTGHVMAEDGKKMSKSLKNYPPVEEVLDSFGADALRYFLLNSPVMRGEKVNLVEKEIGEIGRKIIMRLKNTYTFFETYQEGFDSSVNPLQSPNPLDQWMLARLHETVSVVTSSLDNYELDRAANPFLDLIDDLSTWYLRRSRDRFKGEDESDRAYAQATTVYVLKETATALAPFMPFVSEYLWQRIKGEHDAESVHLTSWPKLKSTDQDIINHMQLLRELVSAGLESRVSVGIKVRQPLQSITLNNAEINDNQRLSDIFDEPMREIIRDELNVKEVLFGETETPVQLDTAISPELQTEGDFREFVRQIQSMRKQLRLSPHDLVRLHLCMDESGQSMINQYFAELQHIAGVAEVDWVDSLDSEEQSANNVMYRIKIESL